MSQCLLLMLLVHKLVVYSELCRNNILANYKHAEWSDTESGTNPQWFTHNIMCMHVYVSVVGGGLIVHVSKICIIILPSILLSLTGIHHSRTYLLDTPNNSDLKQLMIL